MLGAASTAAANSSVSSPGHAQPLQTVPAALFQTRAGVRTSDLLASFQRRGWAASYACSSAPNEHAAALAAAGVATHGVPPNREALLTEALTAAAPTAVVFDRFYAEEAFSFRVRELAPQALRILDMQARGRPWLVSGLTFQCSAAPGTCAHPLAQHLACPVCSSARLMPLCSAWRASPVPARRTSMPCGPVGSGLPRRGPRQQRCWLHAPMPTRQSACASLPPSTGSCRCGGPACFAGMPTGRFVSLSACVATHTRASQSLPTPAGAT